VKVLVVDLQRELVSENSFLREITGNIPIKSVILDRDIFPKILLPKNVASFKRAFEDLSCSKLKINSLLVPNNTMLDQWF